MIPFAAYLRVYEPLDALPADERQRWTEYVTAGQALDPQRGAELEYAESVRALLRTPPLPTSAALDSQAFVHQLDRTVFVCPWRTTPRCWLALTEFRRSLPDDLADAFVSRVVADAAERSYADWQDSHPDRRPGILTSTWSVPIPWFLLFDPQERQLVLGARQGTGRAGSRTGLARALRYMTPMSRARQRLARALHVLRRAMPEGPVAGTLEDLGRWLEDFHPHALVELDYGGLVHLMEDADLSGDDSVPLLAEALGCLAGGDLQGAVERYQRVIVRWRAVAALESAN